MINDLINKFKHLPDDRIGDGIYVAFEWREKELIRIYIGSKASGPMLQYDAPREPEEGYEVSVMDISVEIRHDLHYNGSQEVYFKNGCWTNCYSRGNFGKKYAFGGNWSGHTKNLHPKLMLSPITDQQREFLLSEEGDEITLPPGIKGEIGVTEMDCSGGWSIWYTTAKAALDARLTHDEIQQASLPEITKQHLMKNETSNVIEAIKDVIEAYNL